MVYPDAAISYSSSVDASGLEDLDDFDLACGQAGQTSIAPDRYR